MVHDHDMAAIGNTHSVTGDNELDIETATRLAPASRTDESAGEEDKGSMSEKDRDGHGQIDYDKMEQQAIGVTRIETLWRHFGTNRPVLMALGLSIFCKHRPYCLRPT